MKENVLNLNTLTPHGKANTKIINETLAIWTTHSITSLGVSDLRENLKRHYVLLPGKYHLPFRVDMLISQ